MASVRVRLCIDRDPCLKTEQCWMLVDTSSCKFIRDFEYLIKKKFFTDGHNVVLNLYLDDFLLPAQEKIEVIRDNDVIRVKEDKASTSKREKSSKLTDENKNENTKKRKFEDSKESRKKSKKMKHSPTKNLKKEQNLQQKNQAQSQVASAKTSLKTSNKTKCQKAIEFLQKASSGSSSRKGKKRQTKSLKKKFHSSAFNSILEKFHSSSNNKQIGAPKPEENIALEKGLKKEIHFASKLPLSVQKGSRESNKIVKDVQNGNGIPGSKEDSDSSKQKGTTVDVNKKSSLIQSSQKSSTSSSSSSRGSSSDGESDTTVIKKSTFSCQAVGGSNEPQEGLELQTADQDVVKENELHNLEKQRHDVCRPKQTSSNHIRFDYDSEPVIKTAEKPSLPDLNISPACSASTNNKAPNGTPDLSPIQQNIKLTAPSDNAKKRPTTENKDLNGRCRINNFRKDVYTYKSVVMESTRMEKEPEEALCPVSTNVPEKDFSQYQPLVGPPRVGETVAYKTLELSQSYTPEISQYKVGKVLSFDPISKSMKLKLTKESLTRATGDGHISLKFELLDDDDDDEEGDSSLPVEIPDEVDVQWSEMINPRLIVVP